MYKTLVFHSVAIVSYLGDKQRAIGHCKMVIWLMENEGASYMNYGKQSFHLKIKCVSRETYENHSL